MQWTPPARPWYKINIDGAIFVDSHSAGVGVILFGTIKGRWRKLSKKLHLSLGPSETETKAMEEGVYFSWDVRVRDVFKSDSKI